MLNEKIFKVPRWLVAVVPVLALIALQPGPGDGKVFILFLFLFFATLAAAFTTLIIFTLYLFSRNTLLRQLSSVPQGGSLLELYASRKRLKQAHAFLLTVGILTLSQLLVACFGELPSAYRIITLPLLQMSGWEDGYRAMFILIIASVTFYAYAQYKRGGKQNAKSVGLQDSKQVGAEAKKAFAAMDTYGTRAWRVFFIFLCCWQATVLVINYLSFIDFNY